MLRAVLFDLDGTLLSMDTEAFISHYTKTLAPNLSEIVDENTFLKALWTSTEAMVRSKDADKTNEIVFTETFLPIVEKTKEEIWPALDRFYEEEFPQFASLTSPVPAAREAIKATLKAGLKVAVATNPVFPKKAIEHRLDWAGISDLPLDLITAYENSFFTKPHPQYYESIAAELGVKPSECVMVGNDKQEDMAAAQVGMKTFLVEGHIIDRGEPEYPVSEQGTLEKVIEQIEKSRGIFQTF
jgi:HAD superfamily hydrolase (TIGR01509 family)